MQRQGDGAVGQEGITKVDVPGALVHAQARKGDEGQWVTGAAAPHHLAWSGTFAGSDQSVQDPGCRSEEALLASALVEREGSQKRKLEG